MATNFTIQARHLVNQLRLELAGDFDASSAMQLLYRLRHHCAEDRPIVVDTGALNRIETLGLNLFRYCLGQLQHEVERLFFTGKKADLLRNAWPLSRRPGLLPPSAWTGETMRSE